MIALSFYFVKYTSSFSDGLILILFKLNLWLDDLIERNFNKVVVHLLISKTNSERLK